MKVQPLITGKHPNKGIDMVFEKKQLGYTLSCLYLFCLFSYVGYNSWLSYGLDSMGLKSIIGIVVKSLTNVALIALLLLVLRHWFFKALVLPIISLVIIGLYYIAEQYGAFSEGIFGSLLETNANESKEMLSSAAISLNLLIIAIMTPIALYLMSNIRVRYQGRFMSVNLIVCCLILAKSSSGNIPSLNDQGEYEVIKITPVEYIFRETALLKPFYLQKNYNILREVESQPIVPSWNDVKINVGEKNKAYVVILGESLGYSDMIFNKNRDHSPLNEITNLVVYEKAISPSVVTRFSVPNILSLRDDKELIDSDFNVIDLAKMAGFKTYWISNQSKTGAFDSQISSISKQADVIEYFNDGYANAGSDFKLLDSLKKNLAAGSIYFLHMIGNHPDFCKRASNMPYPLPADLTSHEKDSDCFNKVTFNTEVFLKEIKQYLEQQNLEYEVIFLSDHGLAHIDHSPYRAHAGGKLFSEEAIHVPFFMFGSSIKVRSYDKAPYYLRDFPHTFSEWVGVSAAEVERNKSSFNQLRSQEAYARTDSGRKVYLNE